MLLCDSKFCFISSGSTSSNKERNEKKNEKGVLKIAEVLIKRQSIEGEHREGRTEQQQSGSTLTSPDKGVCENGRSVRN